MAEENVLRNLLLILPLPLRERPPGHVVAANYAHEPGGLFPHPLPSPEGRGGVGSLARFMGRGWGEGAQYSARINRKLRCDE